MTGSGKTGLAIALIEEVLRQGIPVLAIDPKGDLGNLLLLFDDARRRVVRAVDRSRGRAARREGRETAARGRGGRLEEGPRRVGAGARTTSRPCKKARDAVIYTPGSTRRRAR